MSADEKNPTTRPVYTRLELDLAERLERQAEAEDRTLAAQVRHMIKKGLDSQEASAA